VSAAAVPAPILRHVSSALYRRPRLLLALLLGPPLAWLAVVYLGALAALLVQSFFFIDEFSGRVVRQLSLATYRDLLTGAHADIVLRTTLMAGAVTVAAALLAFPLAYYMVRHASVGARALLYLGVMLPLWSSYLVRVYSWKLILAREGIVTWAASALGLGWLLDALLAIPVVGGPSLSTAYLGTFLVFLYVWLPFMVLPIVAALERVPRSLLEASADLGARPAVVFRTVTLPLALPGVVAGSIFTFSLTLGDYIIPGIVGGSQPFIGQAVYQYQGTAGNIPLAAALTIVPIAIMGVYLAVARRLGAFEGL
jgi:putative spermidine/putrescine transport system permease protein